MSGWLAAVAVGLCLAGADGAEPLERHEFTQVRMGVPVTITVYAPSEEVANTAASAAYARLRDLNLMLSDYDPESELMKLCRDSGPGKPIPVSRELFDVLKKAQAVSERSHGAFDVTVGPLVQLWRKARRTKQLPADDALKAARSKVGYQHLVLDESRRTVELRLTGMRLDLGGIAKGYAGDETLKLLKSHGLNRALVAVSGDIVAGDPPPGETGWRIGVGPLENAEAPPKTFLRIANQAVSTAGDAFQFVEIAGTRYSHLLDPATGYGLTHHSSVTVVAADGITSDSLDSAACVLGGRRGMEFLRDAPEKVKALVVEKTETTETSYKIGEFDRLVEPRR